VRQVVWVVGSAPGDGTTVRVVTETVCPGLGCRTRVIVGATVVVVVVVVGMCAGARDVDVEELVTAGADVSVVVVTEADVVSVVTGGDVARRRR
jgi:hypothetical protein